MAAVMLVAVFVCPAQELKPNTEFKVKLLGPLSTETNQKGDKITAQVLTPVQYAGAIMEGEVRESKSGNKFKGRSTLLFTFQTLVPKAGAAMPVSSDVKGFTNSKGQQNVDEEGAIVEKKNNLGKMAAMSGAGALIGALAGGGKGAAIGAGVGAGAALILVQFGAKSPNIRFDPGSEILLGVGPRREDSRKK
ncbi:MAG: hypothetical protein C0504_04930 [Candidatus Solibacter sp.]|nr:hypothetical protein [Candidatus Solibacter sp.]